MRGSEGALIDDAASAAVLRVQLVAAAHEFVDADPHRSGDQSADVHFRARAEEHAVGIHQHDLAIGLDLAEDLTRFLIEDAVQGHRLGVGLLETHLLALGDIEALPIDGGARTVLLDGGDATAGVMLDAGAAGAHLATAGRGCQGRTGERRHQARQQRELQRASQRMESEWRAWHAVVGEMITHVHAVASSRHSRSNVRDPQRCAGRVVRTRVLNVANTHRRPLERGRRSARGTRHCGRPPAAKPLHIPASRRAAMCRPCAPARPS